MPRYYFHLYTDDLMRDGVGQQLAGLAAAGDVARRSVSEVIAEQISRGEKVDLGHRLEVEGDEGIVMVLEYRDLFTGPAV